MKSAKAKAMGLGGALFVALYVPAFALRPPASRVRVLGLVGVNIFGYRQIRLAATRRLYRSSYVSAASGVRATCLCSAMDHRRFSNEEALISSAILARFTAHGACD